MDAAELLLLLLLPLLLLALPSLLLLALLLSVLLALLLLLALFCAAPELHPVVSRIRASSHGNVFFIVFTKTSHT